MEIDLEAIRARAEAAIDSGCGHPSQDGVIPLAEIDNDSTRQIWRCLMCNEILGSDHLPLRAADVLALCGEVERNRDFIGHIVEALGLGDAVTPPANREIELAVANACRARDAAEAAQSQVVAAAVDAEREALVSLFVRECTTNDGADCEDYDICDLCGRVWLRGPNNANERHNRGCAVPALRARIGSPSPLPALLAEARAAGLEKAKDIATSKVYHRGRRSHCGCRRCDVLYSVISDIDAALIGAAAREA